MPEPEGPPQPTPDKGKDNGTKSAGGAAEPKAPADSTPSRVDALATPKSTATEDRSESLGDFQSQELKRITGQFVQRYMTSRFEGVRPRQQRPGILDERKEGLGIWKRFVSLPIIGWFAPDRSFQVTAALEAAGGPALGAAAVASLDAFGMSAILGGVARTMIDGARWAIGKEQTVDCLARTLAKKGSRDGRSWDEATTASIIFGDRGDINQMEAYYDELAKYAGNPTELNGAAERLKDLGSDQLKRLVRTSIGSYIDLDTLQRLVPQDKMALLADPEKEHLQKVKKAAMAADFLVSNVLDKDQRLELSKEMPGYLERREFTNHLKVMATRSGVAALKTGVVGVAATLLRGIAATRLIQSLASRAGEIGTTWMAAGQKWLALASDKVAEAVRTVSIPLPPLPPPPDPNIVIGGGGGGIGGP